MQSIIKIKSNKHIPSMDFGESDEEKEIIEEESQIKFIVNGKIYTPIGEHLQSSNTCTTWLVQENQTRELFILKSADLSFRKEEEPLGKLTEYCKAEISALKNLSHTNIVEWKDDEKDDNLSKYTLVMEYCQHGDLDKYITQQRKKGGYFTELHSCIILSQIAEGLNYAHTRTPKVMHRDIKPQNIVISSLDNAYPNSIHIKICDFGIAKIREEDTELNTYIGTRPYMAPERHMGEEYSGIYADIWSFGVIAFELANLERPFTGNKQISQILNVLLPDINNQYSEYYKQIIYAILKKEPTQRMNLSMIIRLLKNLIYQWSSGYSSPNNLTKELFEKNEAQFKQIEDQEARGKVRHSMFEKKSEMPFKQRNTQIGSSPFYLPPMLKVTIKLNCGCEDPIEDLKTNIWGQSKKLFLYCPTYANPNRYIYPTCLNGHYHSRNDIIQLLGEDTVIKHEKEWELFQYPDLCKYCLSNNQKYNILQCEHNMCINCYENYQRNKHDLKNITKCPFCITSCQPQAPENVSTGNKIDSSTPGKVRTIVEKISLSCQCVGRIEDFKINILNVNPKIFTYAQFGSRTPDKAGRIMPKCPQNHILKHEDLLLIFGEKTLNEYDKEWDHFFQYPNICHFCLSIQANMSTRTLQCSHNICKECESSMSLVKNNPNLLQNCHFCAKEECPFCHKYDVLIYKYMFCDHGKRCRNCCKLGTNIFEGNERLYELVTICSVCPPAKYSTLNPRYCGAIFDTVDEDNPDYFTVLNYFIKIFAGKCTKCKGIYLKFRNHQQERECLYCTSCGDIQ